jgi:KDO2-lipid IV(A) lauroyltransferase
MMHQIEYALYTTLRLLVRHMSYRTAGRLGCFLGTLVYGLGFRKRVTMDNLAHAFPEKSLLELRRIAHGAYCNYGVALLELLWTSGQSREAVADTLHLRNPEVFLNAMARNRGLIFLAAHLGSWELLAIGVGIRINTPVAVIVQTQSNKMVNAAIDADRRRFGNTTIPMGPSVRDIVTVLRGGGVVAMLGDQSAAKEAARVVFFGRPCATHRGAAAFALRLDASLVVAFMFRNADSTYDVEFAEVDCSGLKGTEEERIDQLTRRHTAMLEAAVRRRPDHWLWMHKRWKHTDYLVSLAANHSPVPSAEHDG